MALRREVKVHIKFQSGFLPPNVPLDEGNVLFKVRVLTDLEQTLNSTDLFIEYNPTNWKLKLGQVVRSISMFLMDKLDTSDSNTYVLCGIDFIGLTPKHQFVGNLMPLIKRTFKFSNDMTITYPTKPEYARDSPFTKRMNELIKNVGNGGGGGRGGRGGERLIPNVSIPMEVEGENEDEEEVVKRPTIQKKLAAKNKPTPMPRISLEERKKMMSEGLFD